MSRWWTELMATVETLVPLPLLLLLLLLAATAVALLWYYFPAWVPRRLPGLRLPRWGRLRLRRPRWRLPRWSWPRWRFPKLAWRRLLWWRRRPAEPAEPEPAEVSADEVPPLPAADFVDLADRLAAEGRFAEAVRERLRGMVRDLIERGVIEHRPGWTVTELATVAAQRRPAVAGPLGEAGGIFSDLWYGQRPAGRPHDDRMRELAAALTAALRGPGGGDPASPSSAPATVGAGR